MTLIKKYLPSLLLLVPALSNAEVLHIDSHGFSVENTVTTNTSVDKSWDAFVNNVDEWWPSDHTWWGDAKGLSIDEFAGGCFCEKSGDNSAEHMRVSYVEKEKLLRMTGGLGPLQGMGMYGALDWSFEKTDKGTKISLKYTVNGFSPNGYEELAPIVDKVQAMQLGGLAKFLAK